jgi:hypothetical protein
VKHTLLIVTVGQTDVQLLTGPKLRSELDGKVCAELHDALGARAIEMEIVDAPIDKDDKPIVALPSGSLRVCTPKLDAVLRFASESDLSPTSALVLETLRDPDFDRGEPRMAGTIVEQRLSARGIPVRRVAYLSGRERLEAMDDPGGRIVRREAVERLDAAIRACLVQTPPSAVIVATTGGIKAVSALVVEIVQLLAPAGCDVKIVEVADGHKQRPPVADRAQLRGIATSPADSYVGRRHALTLIEGGNLFGAWGAVKHLADEASEQDWTRVVGWLADFAASLPPREAGCDLPYLRHPRDAVRSALRVELALRAGDIPRAVHGSVAFVESALWDQLAMRLTRHKTHRWFSPQRGAAPAAPLVMERDGRLRRPFELKDAGPGGPWYAIHDDGDRASRIAREYLDRKPLALLTKAIANGPPHFVRDLRNDVAHSEPTPALMKEARKRMIGAGLWTSDDSFLGSPLVQAEMADYGLADPPGQLCTRLLDEVRERLRRARSPRKLV